LTTFVTHTFRYEENFRTSIYVSFSLNNGISIDWLSFLQHFSYLKLISIITSGKDLFCRNYILSLIHYNNCGRWILLYVLTLNEQLHICNTEKSSIYLYTTVCWGLGLHFFLMLARFLSGLLFCPVLVPYVVILVTPLSA
jgi:hypothetical protein